MIIKSNYFKLCLKGFFLSVFLLCSSVQADTTAPVISNNVDMIKSTESQLNSTSIDIVNPVTSSVEAESVTLKAPEPPTATPITPKPVLEPPPAPVVHTKPYLAKFEDISSGDTAWMLAATALVLLMTIPGLVLFYSGMVRKKNVLSTALQSFVICCLVTIIWIVIGYSLAFTPGSSPFLGGFDRIMLSGLSYIKESGQVSVSHIAPTIPESVFVMFQMTFAIITPALIVGAFAERMRFTAMLLFMGLWSVFVYSPVAHCVWEPSGFFASQGVLDFAGGTVVHINAGIAGLVCAYKLGPRRGYGKIPLIPYNLIYTLMGASFLWVGWFGFNAGSAVAADGRAGMAMLVTQSATAVAAMTWMMIEWLVKKRITMLGCASGAVAGLVAITPASGFVGVNGSIYIGLAAGIFCYWGATGLKSILSADDALDVFGIHGIGGLVGAILTGVFADKAISGLDANVWLQTTAAFGTLIYSGIMTYIILVFVNFFIKLRIDAEEEEDGLDISQHSERVH
jgi:Amt family ammonium transporter